MLMTLLDRAPLAACFPVPARRRRETQVSPVRRLRVVARLPLPSLWHANSGRRRPWARASSLCSVDAQAMPERRLPQPPPWASISRWSEGRALPMVGPAGAALRSFLPRALLHRRRRQCRAGSRRRTCKNRQALPPSPSHPCQMEPKVLQDGLRWMQ